MYSSSFQGLLAGLGQLLFLVPPVVGAVLVQQSPAPGRWRGLAFAWAALTGIVVLVNLALTTVLAFGLVPRGGELLFLFLPLLQVVLGLLSLAAGGCAVAAMVSGRRAAPLVGSGA